MLHEHLPSPQETLFVCFQIASLALGTFQRNPCLLASKHRNVPATYSTNTYFRPWKSSTFRCFPSTQLWPCYGQGACSWVPRRFSQCRPSRSCRPRSKCTADPSARHGPWRHWPQGSVGCHPHLDGMTWPEVDDNWISLEWEFPIGLGFHWNWIETGRGRHWKTHCNQLTRKSTFDSMAWHIAALRDTWWLSTSVEAFHQLLMVAELHGVCLVPATPGEDAGSRSFPPVVGHDVGTTLVGIQGSIHTTPVANGEDVHLLNAIHHGGGPMLALVSWDLTVGHPDHPAKKMETYQPDARSIIAHFSPRASERRVLPIVGVCISSSHLHICSSSHLLIFTSAHLHICSSSHLLIFTSSHLHICSSSHLLIFTSSHLHIFSSSHLLIFTSSHLYICSSSHLLIFTSAHLHILTSSLSLSRTHIFTYSHLLSLSPSPLSSLLSLSLLSLSLSFLFPFSLSRLLYLSLFRPRVVPAGSHETSTLSHEMRVDAQKLW